MTAAAGGARANDGWTRPEEVVAQLRAKWDRGTYLRAHAERVVWEPVQVRLKGPSAQDLLDRPGESVAWTEAMRTWAATGGGRNTEKCRIEDRAVRSRSLGHNDVPAMAVFDTLEGLARVVGRADQIATLDRLLPLTADRRPDLESWVASHPMEVLDAADRWERILDVVEWIDRTDTTHVYLRQLDLPGVDTKFVERHRKLLGQLLQVVLPAERVDLAASRFDARFRFRTTPSYVRFRILSPVEGLPDALSELSVRTAELGSFDLAVRTVFVVENQATYLAFPDVPDSIVIFGEGFKASTLEAVPWLAEREVVYWGDIDTHGFRILDQLRARVPGVRSLLMDEATLISHLDRVVVEDSPTAVQLEHLSPAESDLYSDLVEDRFGVSVRLEQERVHFHALRAALGPWMEQR